MKPVRRWLDCEGGDIEAKEEARGLTPLMFAAVNGRMQLLEMLIKRDAAVDAQIRDGHTALMEAAALLLPLMVVRRLLAAGAATELRNVYGWTALLVYAREGHEQVVEVLLEGGAAVDAQKDDGATALMFAAARR